MSAHGMTVTVLATRIAEAIAEDKKIGAAENMSTGSFGPHMVSVIHSIALDFQQMQRRPVDYRNVIDEG